MRKAAHTVNRNARAGERHKWKDRERRRKEERQRMAAEALILEDAYQRGYTDAVEDMRKKKRQRQQWEQEKKARRWYFIKQKACGLAMLAITVLAVWATEGDITIAFITVPLGLTCLISKEMLIMNDYYFTTKERKKNHDTDFRIVRRDR
ncbi:hypothetical protein DWX68_01875 [Clostridium sp. AF20-7]|jgi:hypothetical protein|nr:hypothetical protein DWX68_01875 [Clostridium sp. AF20-7]UWD56828.1 MAG: hypothetical protein [Bacteriophage sp.]UWD65567.1 MAG: hypothetical protein [Bacteriophage sp.]UWG92657.1 MAG: hypothetical protein [Bacteriophage sp.]